MACVVGDLPTHHHPEIPAFAGMTRPARFLPQEIIPILPAMTRGAPSSSHVGNTALVLPEAPAHFPEELLYLRRELGRLPLRFLPPLRLGIVVGLQLPQYGLQLGVSVHRCPNLLELLVRLRLVQPAVRQECKPDDGD